MKRWLCILLVLLLPATALGEAALLESFPWSALNTQPLACSATLTLSARMPLDEVRLGDLNALMRHLRISAQRETFAGETWEGLTLTLDDAELIRLTQVTQGGQSRLTLSTDDSAYAAEGSCLNALLGIEPVDTDGVPLMWLHDAESLLAAIQTAWPERLSDVKSKTTVKGYGTATRKKTWTVKKADAAGLAAELADLTPAGELQDFLASLTFTGAQKLICLTTDDGTVLRVTWEGTVGVGDDSREGTLAWNLLRTDSSVRDALTIKSPAVRGRNRDTLTLSREVSVKNGLHTLALEAMDDWRRGEQRTIVTLKADLTYDGVMLTGDLSATEEKSGTEEGTQGLTLAPNAALTWDERGALLNGSIGWALSRDGHVTYGGVLDLQTAYEGDASWTMPALAVPLASLSDERREAITAHMIEVVASRLVKAAALLPAEDALYFSRGLDGWAELVQAVAGENDILWVEALDN